MNRLLLIVGSGRCGLLSLVHVLNRQPGAKVSFEEPPLLPWKRPGDGLLRERFARWRRNRGEGVLGDAASFYLPYLEDALAAEPDLRVVGLKRPREETVASFGRFLDETNAFPTNHWADEPGVGWSHDPLRTRCFPQYDVANREDGIRRYWDDYYRTLGELAEKHPNNIRIFDMAEALNTEAGQRAVLDFAGFPGGEWIDSDVEFHPDAVGQLRAHGLPICCGVYPQKGRRALACHVLPGTPQIECGPKE